jgi:hypothetical protein
MAHIELEPVSLSPSEAEAELAALLRAYGVAPTAELVAGTVGLTVKDAKGNQSKITYPHLLTELHLTGACELHRLRWQDTDPHGTITVWVPEGVPIVIGTGVRNSQPVQGPGYGTSDVVGEILGDVLHFRKQVAEFSRKRESFALAFRAYRGYLGACVTAVDAALNRLSWFALNEPGTALGPKEEKLLRRRSLPLEEKLRCWVPLLTAGGRLSESAVSWVNCQAIRTARNGFVHANEPDFAFSLQASSDVLNLCRAGVGQLLMELSGLLSRNPAPAILRVARAPRAVYVTGVNAA